jgi:hypothetical protein
MNEIVQTIRADLTVRTRERNRTLPDLISEIELMATIGEHPNIVGFVGRNPPMSLRIAYPRTELISTIREHPNIVGFVGNP